MDQSNHWRKPFFTLYFGQAFSLLSSGAVQFAIIWWITVKTGSAISLTIASVVGLLPQVLLGTFAGVVVDRHKRKNVMIVADCAVAISSLALGVLVYLSEPGMVVIYVFLFLRALGETFHKSALQAVIPQLVPPEDLTRAGGFGQLVSSLCSMAGPILGALLATAVPLQFAMLVDIAGAIVAMLAVLKVKVPDYTLDSTARTSMLHEMLEGFRIIKGDKSLVIATIPVFLTSMVFMPLGSFLPLMVKQYFRRGPLDGGIVQMMFSVGMLSSAFAFGVMGKSNRQFTFISLSTFLLGLCAIIGGVLPANAFWAFCVVVFVIGTTGMMGSIPYMAYIQKSVVHHNMGKVISTITSIVSLGIPVGMFIAGPIAEQVGVGNWMVGVGIMLVLIGLSSYVATRGFDRERKLQAGE